MLLKERLWIKWDEKSNCYLASIPDFPNLKACGDSYTKVLKEAKILLENITKKSPKDEAGKGERIKKIILK